VEASIAITGPHSGKAAACEPILRALPGWFGIEAAIVNYVRSIDELPTFLAVMDEQVVGFLTLKQHTDYSAEIYVMAVAPQVHRAGIGRELVREAERALRESKVEYLQVKTLAASHPSPEYAKTRAFYVAQGFRPLEEFPNLWPGNPCLLMVKYLGQEG